jgi:hypothetical protein
VWRPTRGREEARRRWRVVADAGRVAEGEAGPGEEGGSGSGGGGGSAGTGKARGGGDGGAGGSSGRWLGGGFSARARVEGDKGRGTGWVAQPSLL